MADGGHVGAATATASPLAGHHEGEQKQKEGTKPKFDVQNERVKGKVDEELTKVMNTDEKKQNQPKQNGHQSASATGARAKQPPQAHAVRTRDGEQEGERPVVDEMTHSFLMTMELPPVLRQWSGERVGPWHAKRSRGPSGCPPTQRLGTTTTTFARL